MDPFNKYAPLIILLPFFIALPRFKSMTTERRYLFAAIILGIIGEISMYSAARIWRNNMPVLHIYTLLEFCLLVSVFYHGKMKFISKQWYRIILIGYSIVWIGSLIFFQGILESNSITRSLEGIILISLALLFFFVLLQRLEILNPEKTFMFWFSVAILFYFGGNLLVFIFSNHLTQISIQSGKKLDLVLQITIIINILNFFLYIFYTIAFLCKESKTIPKSSLSAP